MFFFVLAATSIFATIAFFLSDYGQASSEYHSKLYDYKTNHIAEKFDDMYVNFLVKPTKDKTSPQEYF